MKACGTDRAPPFWRSLFIFFLKYEKRPLYRRKKLVQLNDEKKHPYGMKRRKARNALESVLRGNVSFPGKGEEENSARRIIPKSGDRRFFSPGGTVVVV
jgi:hypothetical protein